MAPPVTLADLHRRIAACQHDGALRAVTLCFFGDSNTRGMASDPDRHRRAFPSRLLAELADRYAPCAFQGIDAGKPGDTITAALERLERDVLLHMPDLTILAFGLNDAVQGGRDGVTRYVASLHAALDRLLPNSAVVLLTPGMMATDYTSRVPELFSDTARQCIATQRDGVLDTYVAALRQVAVEREAPLADTYALWQSLVASGVDTTALLVNGINHPHGYMHDLYAVPVMACLEASMRGDG
jgi:lysophospholipase L1-like esterase